MPAIADAKLLILTNLQAKELAGQTWNVNGSEFRFKPYKADAMGDPPWRKGAEGTAYPLLGPDGQPAVYLKCFSKPKQQRLDRTAWLIGQKMHQWIPQLAAAPQFWVDTRNTPAPTEIDFHFSGCMAKAVPGLTWLELKSCIYSRLIKFDDARRWQAINDLIHALAVLEQVSICHGDLSPNNVIVDVTRPDSRPVLYLIDFDAFVAPHLDPHLAVVSGQHGGALGTEGYCPPDILTRLQEDDPTVAPYSDRFGRDMLMLELLLFDSDVGTPDDPPVTWNSNVLQKSLAKLCERVDSSLAHVLAHLRSSNVFTLPEKLRPSSVELARALKQTLPPPSPIRPAVSLSQTSAPKGIVPQDQTIFSPSLGQVTTPVMTPTVPSRPQPAPYPTNIPILWRRVFAFLFLCMLAFVVQQWRGKKPTLVAPTPVEATQNQPGGSAAAKTNRPHTPIEATQNHTIALVEVDMKLIPTGEFLMGSPETEYWEPRSELQRSRMRFGGSLGAPSDSEGPQHLVRLTRPFYLSAYEVTQGQFEAITGANPSRFSKSEHQVKTMDTSRFPVENISWFDAIEFCNSLSVNHSLPPYYSLTNVKRLADPSVTSISQDGTRTTYTPTNVNTIRSATVVLIGGCGYRLPTEAEWEYACRANTTTAFHFGSTLDPHYIPNADKANINVLPEPEKTFSKSLWRTTRVGSYEPNAFGLFDMHGNVGEWCWDWYDEQYYSQFGGDPAIDPIGPPSGKYRSQRGGSWHDLCHITRSACRSAATPDFNVNAAGFRVARTADDHSPVKVSTNESTRPSPPVLRTESKSNTSETPNQKKETSKPVELPVSYAAGITVKIDLKLIAAGEFTMGCNSSQPGYKNGEGPTHQVTISRPYYIGVYEVTQQQYRTVMGNNPSYFSKNGDGKSAVSDYDTRRFPVENVSWFDAVEFCNKLSAQEHRPPCYRRSDNSEVVEVLESDGYRLPTEAEWENACRAQSTYPFHTSKNLNGNEANFNGTYLYPLNEGASALDPPGVKRDSEGKYLVRTTTVGSYQPNRFGLYDMHGNVNEWCSDWYHPDFYSQVAHTTFTDPVGPLTSNHGRALRGGSWFSRPHTCRSASRMGGSPDVKTNVFGFRVARTP